MMTKLKKKKKNKKKKSALLITPSLPSLKRIPVLPNLPSAADNPLSQPLQPLSSNMFVRINHFILEVAVLIASPSKLRKVISRSISKTMKIW